MTMLALGITGHRMLTETDKILAGVEEALERIRKLFLQLIKLNDLNGAPKHQIQLSVELRSRHYPTPLFHRNLKIFFRFDFGSLINFHVWP